MIVEASSWMDRGLVWLIPSDAITSFILILVKSELIEYNARLAFFFLLRLPRTGIDDRFAKNTDIQWLPSTAKLYDARKEAMDDVGRLEQ